MNLHANPTHEGKVADAIWNNNVIDCIIENCDGTLKG